METAALAPDIRFDCSHCEQPLVVTAEAAGLRIPCPLCQNDLAVPHASVREVREYRAPRKPVPSEEDRLRHELTELKALAEGLELEASVVAQKLAKAHQEVSTAKKEAARVRTEASAWEQEAVTAQAATESWREKSTLLQGQLETALQSGEAKSTQLEAAEARLLSTQHDLAEARSQADSVRHDFARVEEQLEHERHLSAATRLELQTLTEQARTTTQELAQARSLGAKAETSATALQKTCEGMSKEMRQLKRQMADSERGREILKLRKEVESLQETTARGARALQEAQTEALRHREREEQLDTDFRAYRQRAEKHLAHTEDSAEAALKKDLELLRGLMERQRAELEEKTRSLAGLRRANLAVRLTYALIILVTMAAVAMGVWWLQRVAPGMLNW